MTAHTNNPDSAAARVEDFAVHGDSDGATTLVCAHYARGCWWASVSSSGYLL
jgi:hypothetical protein